MSSPSLAAARHSAPSDLGRPGARAADRLASLALHTLSARLAALTLPHGASAAFERSLALRRLLRDVTSSHRIEVATRGATPDAPCVLVANHVSYLDPIVIGSVVACAPVAKAELAGWPLVGATARELGAIFVRRGDTHSGARALRQALRALEGGASVLVFPEGTTTDGSHVAPFAPGAFGLAALAGVPVATVTVAYDDPRVAWTGDATFVPHYLRLVREPSVGCALAFGPQLSPSRARDARDVAALARSLVAAPTR